MNRIGSTQCFYLNCKGQKNKLANIKKTVMGTNPTGNQQRKKYYTRHQAEY